MERLLRLRWQLSLSLKLRVKLSAQNKMRSRRLRKPATTSLSRLLRPHLSPSRSRNRKSPARRLLSLRRRRLRKKRRLPFLQLSNRLLKRLWRSLKLSNQHRLSRRLPLPKPRLRAMSSLRLKRKKQRKLPKARTKKSPHHLMRKPALNRLLRLQCSRPLFRKRSLRRMSRRLWRKPRKSPRIPQSNRL